jgi:quinate dehydrogenase (quinone)
MKARAVLAALVLAAATVGAQGPPSRYTTWRDYGGSSDSMQYSALREIDKRNVNQLELAWFYPVPDRTGNFGFNPIVVDGVMYVLGPRNSIVALDAASGRQMWAHGVESGSPGNRGINYWESKDRSDRRLIFVSGGALRALDARTGKPIEQFGSDGKVDMRTGLLRPLGNPSGTPGRVFENLLITGSNTGEMYQALPGDIRAYDIVSGQLVWTFHTIPYPGEYGYDTWPPDAYKWAGGVNVWGEISIDEKRGIGYFPLGSPTHDSYGGDRKGANLFGNSLVALDLRTGKRLWHFQTVHHDIWDYDLTTAPKLLTVRHNGKPVDVVAQATKFGLLYVFDRISGRPLWPIEERPVPKSDVPGEETSPTQPFPTRPEPYARLKFDASDINPHVEAAEQQRLREILTKARNEGVFTPQTLDRNQISIPGELGGSNWGGTAADPTTGMLYVRTADQPAIHKLRQPRAGNEDTGGNRSPSDPPRPALPEIDGLTRYTGPLGSMFRSQNGLPAISPPWAQLVAYDLNEGVIKWRAPLGVVRALAAKGITNTGNAHRVHRNGPVVTAGGLIFIGTNADGYVRAFDKDTGKVLWERALDANPEGLAATYEVDGRQYVVFCASHYPEVDEDNIAIFKGAASAQGYYVFALPASARLKTHASFGPSTGSGPSRAASRNVEALPKRPQGREGGPRRTSF